MTNNRGANNTPKWMYLLVILFGSSTWLCVNCLWLELSLLVNALPEKWTLPSFLAVIIQLASVGPILYSIWEKLLSKGHVNQRGWLICCYITLGAVCLFLMTFLWSRTGWVAGAERSVAVFILFFFMSIVSSTSNVLFLPFMVSFRPELMTSFFIGMGVSALVPSILSLAQGAGNSECVTVNTTDGGTAVFSKSIPPNFSIEIYFASICGWMVLALIAFIVLLWKGSPNKKDLTEGEGAGEKESPAAIEEEEQQPVIMDSDQKATYHSQDEDEAMMMVKVKQPALSPSSASNDLSVSSYLFLLFMTVWVNLLMNGWLPSIQSFSCLPYGSDAYHLAVVFSNLANPVACFIPFFIKVKRYFIVVTSWTIVATLLAAYITLVAALSPSPFLVNTTTGAVLTVFVWTLVFGVLAYLRTVMASRLREASGNSESRLFWCGAMTQIGAFLGSIIAFPLVNVDSVRVFTGANPCATGGSH